MEFESPHLSPAAVCHSGHAPPASRLGIGARGAWDRTYVPLPVRGRRTRPG